MLTELTITNFALIDYLEVNFSKGMTSITGETGAGKSILLGGLALVLGKRADLSTLKDKSKKCFVEATFSISAYQLQAFFDTVDLDYEPITTIRREIVPSGKSRAFINDTPVTLDVLSQLGEKLIDIHSQHQTLSLTQEDYQLEVLDALAGNKDNLIAYQEYRQQFFRLKQEISHLETQKEQLEQEHDYNSFLLEELQKAPLNEGILEQLEEEIQQLSHVEEIELHLSKALQIVEEEQLGIQMQLNEVKASLNKIADFGEQFSQLNQRTESILIELNDISAELNRSLEQLEANPIRLEEINSQYQLLNNLLKKHHAQSIEELQTKRDELDRKVVKTANLDETLNHLAKELNTIERQLTQRSEVLSQKRHEVIPIFVEKMIKILSLVGMANARFQLELFPSEDF